MTSSTGEKKRKSGRALRRQLIVAPKAQGRVLFRAMLYGIISSAATVFLYLGFRWLFAGANEVFALLAAFTTTVLVGTPMILHDSARTSNRLVGPFVRVHGVVRRISEREPTPPLSVRDAADWVEWFQDFNVMMKRVQGISAVQEKDGEKL